MNLYAAFIVLSQPATVLIVEALLATKSCCIEPKDFPKDEFDLPSLFERLAAALLLL